MWLILGCRRETLIKILLDVVQIYWKRKMKLSVRPLRFFLQSCRVELHKNMYFWFGSFSASCTNCFGIFGVSQCKHWIIPRMSEYQSRDDDSMSATDRKRELYSRFYLYFCKTLASYCLIKKRRFKIFETKHIVLIIFIILCCSSQLLFSISTHVMGAL